MRMHTDISSHEAQFLAYAQGFCEAELEHKDMLLLKVHHSHEVLRHMRHLVERENVLFPHARACLLAALYHDVARFYQFSLWRTFKDSPGCNHGLLGVKILKEKQFLQEETKHIQTQVLAAVGMHNRFKVPPKIPQDIALITYAVRDADKLDILRIMAEHFRKKEGLSSAVVLHAKDDAQGWSPKIVDAVLQGRVASYGDIQYVNDFKLLLGTWLHDLYFASSRSAFATSGYMQGILQDLPHIAEVDEAKAHIENMLHKALQEEA